MSKKPQHPKVKQLNREGIKISQQKLVYNLGIHALETFPYSGIKMIAKNLIQLQTHSKDEMRENKQ